MLEFHRLHNWALPLGVTLFPMKPRPLAVALGVLTCLCLCVLLAKQDELLRLAVANGVSYVYTPVAILLLISILLMKIGEAVSLGIRRSAY